MHDEKCLVVLATVRWDYLWQRHQSLAAAAVSRGWACYFVESQPRRVRQLTSGFRHVLTRVAGREPIRNPRQGVTIIPPSAVAVLAPAWWARRVARQLRRAGVRDPHVILYSPSAAYVQLARRIGAVSVVYDAVIDWETAPASWFPPVRARDAERALPAHWRVTSDNQALADKLSGALGREVALVLPAADKPFLEHNWTPVALRGPIVGWFGAVRDETDVPLLIECARAGIDVEVVGPTDREDLRSALEAAGIRVHPPVSLDELPARIGHWRVAICAYRGARAETITPAKIFNAVVGFTTVTRGIRVPEELRAIVTELPLDNASAVGVVERLVTLTDERLALENTMPTWQDRLDAVLMAGQ